MDRDYYLLTIGIERWVRRRGAPATNVPVAPQVVDSPPDAAELPAPVIGTDCATDDWGALQARVRDCTACELHRSRTQTVFGVGDPGASWMVVGEAPGAEEDRQGEPFVGRAGQLLNAMLKAVDLGREQVYIANILKCRPPDNRDPRPGEVACCEAYLHRQLELVRPQLILAVGRFAAQNLLKSDIAIGKLRGKVHYYGKQQIPVVVTYHPAYLLRSPAEKRRAWEDLKLARRTVAAAGTVSEV